MHDVPRQKNSWSCGVVAGASTAAILGMPVWDYEAFHNSAATHALGLVECGPGPGNLYDMLRSGMDTRRAPTGFGLGLDITADWAPQVCLSMLQDAASWLSLAT